MKSEEKNEKKIVLDTNIIIAAAISPKRKPAQIFEMVLKGEITNFTTQEILDELNRSLQKEVIRTRVEKLGTLSYKTIENILTTLYQQYASVLSKTIPRMTNSLNVRSLRTLRISSPVTITCLR